MAHNESRRAESQSFSDQRASLDFSGSLAQYGRPTYKDDPLAWTGAFDDEAHGSETIVEEATSPSFSGLEKSSWKTSSWPSSPSWEEKKDCTGDSRSPRCTPSPPSSLGNFRKGGRIARLSSLFGSRKAVETTDKAAATLDSPPSPQHSSSSGGYVGWPGTQDRQGRTVNIESSYEESSVGQSSQDPSSRYASELQAPRREVGRWAEKSSKTTPPPTDTSFSSSTTASSHSKSPTGVLMEAGTRNSRAEEWQQHLRTSYDKTFDLADAIAKSSVKFSRSPQISGSRKAISSGPSARLELDQKSGVYSVRSLIQKLDTSGTAGDAFEDFDPLRERRLASKTFYTATASTASPSPYPRISSLARPQYDPYGAYDRPTSAYVALTSSVSLHVAPTRDALAANDRMTPARRQFINSQGYRGLVDKTKDVPCLMDDADSDSMTSSKATSTFSSQQHSNVDPPARSFADYDSPPRRQRLYNKDVYSARESIADDDSDVFDGVSAKESDVFDGLSKASPSPRRSGRSRGTYPASIAEEDLDDEEAQIVVLGGGLTAIQTKTRDFVERKTASDYDDNLSNSDVDQFGFTATPDFKDMMMAGLTSNSSLLGIQSNFAASSSRRIAAEGVSALDSSASSLFSDPYELEHVSHAGGDLSKYAVDPAQMKQLVRKYRKFSDCINDEISLDAFEKEEDEHKAFALFEMRSRIMANDLDRGLERAGGTVAVDDLVLTPYNRTAHRIRDAVIVSKAWRDGASPRDVIKSAMLTRRQDHVYFIQRPTHPGAGMDVGDVQHSWWEPVQWLDDTSFAQFRCPSLGPRHLRGVEIFTIADCQSMLLKLTNERCLELRLALKEATQYQLEVEELLANEGDAGDGMMTETEVEYIGSMEEVKMISRQLVQAEQSFSLVRERIERLVRKYEQLLSKIDTDSLAGASSVMTFESSYVSEQGSAHWRAMEEQEKAVLARRAQRAEVKAEIAARETLLLKQEARIFREQKQRELETLQRKLCELQSESSYSPVDRGQAAKLAQSLAIQRRDGDKDRRVTDDQRTFLDGDRVGLAEVKKRFRERMKDRLHQHGQPALGGRGKSVYESSKRPLDPALRDLFRSAGEEMCQQLDFYERSLRAVETELS
jgi:hypothetical protein